MESRHRREAELTMSKPFELARGAASAGGGVRARFLARLSLTPDPQPGPLIARAWARLPATGIRESQKGACPFERYLQAQPPRTAPASKVTWGARARRGEF